MLQSLRMRLDSVSKYHDKQWTGQKTPSSIYPGSGPNFHTDSAITEQDPIHRLKACVNFIEIGTYQPVI